MANKFGSVIALVDKAFKIPVTFPAMMIVEASHRTYRFAYSIPGCWKTKPPRVNSPFNSRLSVKLIPVPVFLAIEVKFFFGIAHIIFFSIFFSQMQQVTDYKINILKEQSRFLDFSGRPPFFSKILSKDEIGISQ